MTNKGLLEDYYKATHGVWVKRLASRTPSIMDAEDVVQEAFLQALEFVDSYDPEMSSIQTWFTCIINRTHYKMRAKEYNSVEIQEGDIFTPPADEYEGDEDLYNRVVSYIKKEAKENKRQVLWLYFVSGVKMPDVARITDETIYNVRKIIERFKLDMRKKVAT